MLCAADKTGAKVIEDWICPTSSPTPQRPHDDDPSAGHARTHAQASSAGGTSSMSRAESDTYVPGSDAVEGAPVVGAYIGGTIAILITLLAVTAVVSYYVAARS